MDIPAFSPNIEPERPPKVPASWKFCRCGIRCKPSKWVSRSTYQRHQDLVTGRQEALAGGRSFLSSGGVAKSTRTRRRGSVSSNEDDNAEAGPSHHDDAPVVARHSDDEDIIGREASVPHTSDIPTPEGVIHPDGPELPETGHQSPMVQDDASASDTSDDDAEEQIVAQVRAEDREADEELAHLAQITINAIDDQDSADEPPAVPVTGTSTTATGTQEDPPPRPIHIADLRTSQAFIEALRRASLDNGDLPDHVVERLHEPLVGVPDLTNDRALAFSLEYYLRLDYSANVVYNSARTLVKKYFNIEMLSLDQVKRKAEELTGVIPIYTDMCINTCAAFSGPFAQLDSCPLCSEPRFDDRDKRQVPRKQCVTIPVGPQIQAAYRSRESAQAMRYRGDLTKKILFNLHNIPNFELDAYTDYIHSSQYLHACDREDITENDTVLLFSIDGAQLYRMKESDCWIYIWVILDRHPSNRYKNKHILIGGVVPGPRKPKNIESFLFPGFHHVAALMKEGFCIWRADTNTIFSSHPFIPFFLGDGPGIALLNGLVGHHGRCGCRLYCALVGRHKPGAGGHYYPVLKKPVDVTGSAHQASQHADVDITLPLYSDSENWIERYAQNLETVLHAPSNAAYERARRNTGITKPTLVSGFPTNHIFPIPLCFPADIMHLAGIQIPDLIIPLLRGTLQCTSPDKVETWDWAVLRPAEKWVAHGATVAATKPYLPSSFDRPPRNIAEKLTSGYKAAEFLTYLFGLGPAILFGVLPMPYWRNLCKMIRGVRIIYRYKKRGGITSSDLEEAHKLLTEFVIEFEDLYYQRKVSRLHFIRQSIHGLVHLASETINTGPYTIKSQWPIERTIGILGGQIRQPSKPYANLAQRAIRRCQVNALKHIYPSLDPDAYGPPLPRGAYDIGDGYVLKRFRDRTPHTLRPCEAEVLRDFIQTQGMAASPEWLAAPSVIRWARLQLPTGQLAGAWKEKDKHLADRRTRRMVEVSYDGKVEIAEVYFYFFLDLEMEPAQDERDAFALVSIVGSPDAELLELSSKTFWSCVLTGDNGLAIINVKAIHSTVAIIPQDVDLIEDVEWQERLRGRWYMVPELGADTGVSAIDAEGDNEDHNERDEEAIGGADEGDYAYE